MVATVPALRGSASVLFNNTLVVFGGAAAPDLYTRATVADLYTLAVSQRGQSVFLNVTRLALAGAAPLAPPPRHLCSMVLWEPGHPVVQASAKLAAAAATTTGAAPRLVVFGGAQDYAALHTPTLNDVWIFDLGLRAWTALTPTTPAEDTPAPRYGHVAALAGDTMFVFGGRTPAETTAADLHSLHLPTGRWARVAVDPAQWPAGRVGAAFLQLSANVVVLAGGLMAPTADSDNDAADAVDATAAAAAADKALAVKAGSTTTATAAAAAAPITHHLFRRAPASSPAPGPVAPASPVFARDVHVCVWAVPAGGLARCTPVDVTDAPAQAYGQLVRGPATVVSPAAATAVSLSLLMGTTPAGPADGGGGAGVAPSPLMNHVSLGCPPGFSAASLATLGCTLCPAGTFMPATAAADADANTVCTPCPHGTTTPPGAGWAGDPSYDGYPTSARDCAVCALPCRAASGTCEIVRSGHAVCLCAPLWGGSLCGSAALSGSSVRLNYSPLIFFFFAQIDPHLRFTPP